MAVFNGYIFFTFWCTYNSCNTFPELEKKMSIGKWTLFVPHTMTELADLDLQVLLPIGGSRFTNFATNWRI